MRDHLIITDSWRLIAINSYSWLLIYSLPRGNQQSWPVRAGSTGPVLWKSAKLTCRCRFHRGDSWFLIFPDHRTTNHDPRFRLSPWPFAWLLPQTTDNGQLTFLSFPDCWKLNTDSYLFCVLFNSSPTPFLPIIQLRNIGSVPVLS